MDIEQGAVDIARLRFWLAILVEEQFAKPLPNLDYRIVRGFIARACLAFFNAFTDKFLSSNISDSILPSA